MQPLEIDSGDRHARYSAFCHDISGALFEALAETGHRVVESAAMETYLTLTEVVEDHDNFCLTMLWSLMSELDVRLSQAEQTTVIETAASFFAPRTTPNPVGVTLRTLQSVGFIDGFSMRSVCETDERRAGADPPETAGETWELTVGQYALAERTGRIPTLPVAVCLRRCAPEFGVRFIGGEALSDGRWRLRVQLVPGGDSAGLVSVEAIENRWLNDTGASQQL
ncbi:hypothetical protein C440_14419 [Haloferax mucosum ATCC BAA-1512]|uniref:DUF7551 domain-containing protein n=2 Tax=Haloferax mucosum TaxID=403181 RepID=M0I458_9EURY|nr:hypothetical protein C440_14419 [Haloferax mucosum ATCC BAA-1512]